MPKEIVEIQLKRNAAKKEPWGLRIGGGVNRGKVLVLEKVFLCLSMQCSIYHSFNSFHCHLFDIHVITRSSDFQIIFNSVAYEAGLKQRDYLYEINGVNVLEMSHDECTKLIKSAGNTLDLKVER